MSIPRQGLQNEVKAVIYSPPARTGLFKKPHMNPLKSLITYLRASKTELEKVTWPSREETVRYSVLVIIVCAATAIFFATLDFGFREGLDTMVTTLRPDLAGETAPAPQTELPVTPDVQPFEPETGGGIEAVDEFGNPTEDFQIETIPAEGSGDPFTITPETDSGEQQ